MLKSIYKYKTDVTNDEKIKEGNGKLRLPELLATDTSVYLRILSTVAADND